MPKNFSYRLTALLSALILGISTGIVSYTGAISNMDQFFTNWFYDHLILDHSEERITLITIDDKTEKRYGNYDTWSRSILADAVNELNSNGSTIIGLDLDLSKNGSDTDGDNSLSQACQNASSVIAVSSVTYSNEPDPAAPRSESSTESVSSKPDTFMNENDISHDTALLSDNEDFSMKPADFSTKFNNQKIDHITFPFSSLLDSVTVSIGNATQESYDGMIRNSTLTVHYDGDDYDSFAWAVYKQYQDANGEPFHLPQLDNNQLFGFSNISDTTNYNIISLCDLIDGNYDSSLINEHIVLIGKYNSPTTNEQSTFFNPNGKQQELTMQASIIESMLNQKTVVAVDALIQALLYSLIIILVHLISIQRRTRWPIIINLLLPILVLVAGYWANQMGYHFLILVPILAYVLSQITCLIQRLLYNKIAQKNIEQTLKMYVGPQVVDKISEKAPHELALVSERRQIAVLFVDIRNFTTISESLAPEEVVEILNVYLTLVSTAIADSGGTLDKFIGDAAMAIFNAPKDQNDYIYKAVCAAKQIMDNADIIRKKFEQKYGKTVSFGIGINCGEAIVGNIGCEDRMDYTAIGDTVNIASRLESRAKAGQILVSEAVYHSIKDRIKATSVGSLSLKGKTNTVNTYQIDQIDIHIEH